MTKQFSLQPAAWQQLIELFKREAIALGKRHRNEPATEEEATLLMAMGYMIARIGDKPRK